MSVTGPTPILGPEPLSAQPGGGFVMVDASGGPGTTRVATAESRAWRAAGVMVLGILVAATPFVWRLATSPWGAAMVLVGLLVILDAAVVLVTTLARPASARWPAAAAAVVGVWLVASPGYAPYRSTGWDPWTWLIVTLGSATVLIAAFTAQIAAQPAIRRYAVRGSRVVVGLGLITMLVGVVTEPVAGPRLWSSLAAGLLVTHLGYLAYAGARWIPAPSWPSFTNMAAAVALGVSVAIPAAAAGIPFAARTVTFALAAAVFLLASVNAWESARQRPSRRPWRRGRAA